MATEIRNGYVCPQIMCCKRSDKMIEILNGLNPPQEQYAENLYACEKYDDNGNPSKEYSVLPLRIFVYKTKQTSKYNLEPHDIYSLERETTPALLYRREYERKFTKKFTFMKDGKLMMKMATLDIKCQNFTDKEKTKPKDNRWYICIDERLGEAGKGSDGSYKIVKVHNSSNAYVLLNDYEWQKLIDKTIMFLNTFAIAFSAPLLRDKYKTMAKHRAAYKLAKAQ